MPGFCALAIYLISKTNGEIDMCEINCSFECVASYPGSRGPGSVKYLTCPIPRMLVDCPKRMDFYELVCMYQDKGDTPAAALWKARQVNNIPSEYDIGGEVRSWRRQYKPDTLPEIEELERAFLGETKPENFVAHCPAPEREQISIWEVMD